jgi:hypothetical protein
MPDSPRGKVDEENIAAVEAALGTLRALGATVVEPPPEGLFTPYLRRHYPELMNASYAAKEGRGAFEGLAGAKFGAGAGKIAALLALGLEPGGVPEGLTIRDLSTAVYEGQGTYRLERYLRERGDASVRTIQDLVRGPAGIFNCLCYPPLANCGQLYSTEALIIRACQVEKATFFEDRKYFSPKAGLEERLEAKELDRY